MDNAVNVADWFARSQEHLRHAYRSGAITTQQALRLAIVLAVIERVGEEHYDDLTWGERRSELLRIGVDIQDLRADWLEG